MSWLRVPFLRGGGIDSWTVRGNGETPGEPLGGGGDVEQELEPPTPAPLPQVPDLSIPGWCGWRMAGTVLACVSAGKLLPRS